MSTGGMDDYIEKLKSQLEDEKRQHGRDLKGTFFPTSPKQRIPPALV
jgi:hypothetical protein